MSGTTPLVTAPVFYFDFNSPYAYLAAARIEALIPDADWRPIAFPFLLHQQGRLDDVLRRDFPNVLPEVRGRAADRGLPPVEPPPGWPVESWSLAPLRAAVFAGSRSLTDDATLRDAAAQAGLDPVEVEEAIARPDVKQRLKDNTDEAHDRGVKGIPTVAIGEELFWGDDRLEEAAAAAGGLSFGR